MPSSNKVRKVTSENYPTDAGREGISIHALREEGDVPSVPAAGRLQNFYPRPPRGGRPSHMYSYMAVAKFLSTPSARRATDDDIIINDPEGISIHALREEGDCPRSGPSTLRTVFLSTPSARRATRTKKECSCNVLISIHALREEGDSAFCGPSCGRQNFYPRPPRGGRPTHVSDVLLTTQFLSTPSARRATTSAFSCLIR